MKKTIAIFTALTTVLWLSGVAMLAPIHVQAADIIDGDVVREADEFDVYIIKLVGDKKFKRLVLNPDVFNMYGHLEWSNVEVVEDGTLDAYTTSTTVRADGDDKVYQLYPDGDVGTKKWVESLDCFTSQGLDWDSVYVINTFDRDSYTTAATTLCGEEVEGEITLSLASDTPGADTIPENAANVTFLKFNVEGSGTISQLVLKRSGAGETDEFSNVYLYEGNNRLVNGRSVSSATSKVTFINLDIEAPTTISVVADLYATNSTPGNVNYFEIESASDVTSTATIGGTFPIAGNEIAIAAASGGTLTVYKSGSISDPQVGKSAAHLSKFKLTTANETISMKRARMINGGDLAASKLTNLELKVGGTVVATCDGIDSDNYATFVFSGDGYEITKGDSIMFDVYGDVAGSARVADTVKFYFETSNDIYGIGQSYGFGAAVSFSSNQMSTNSSTNCHNLTLEGGALTIAYNGPVAGDISEKGKDVVFLDLTLTAAQDIEIRKTRLVICWADGGTTYTDISGSTNWNKIKDEIEDIKIINKDTGAVIAGPVDADAAGWAVGDDVTSCSGTVDGAYYDFTDTYNLTAGESLNIQTTFDFANSLTDIVAADWFSMVLEGWSNADLKDDINTMRYTGTTTAVDDADIVPATDIMGKNMAVISPELRIGLSALPQDATYVKGTKLIDVVGFTLEATKGSDITVTQFKPTVYVSDAGTTFAAGTDDSLIAKNLISAVYLYEGDTKIAGPKGFSGTTDRFVDFDNLEYIVPAGTTKIVTIKVDLHNYILTSTDSFTFTLGAITDIASQDDEANDLTEKGSTGGTYTAADTNGTTSPTTEVTVSGAGTLAVEALDTPVSTAVYFGQTSAELANYTFSATNEAFFIDRLNAVVSATSGGQNEADNIDEFSSLVLEYTNKDGDILTMTKGFGATATIGFTGFAEADRPYVPKDGDLTVTVYGNMNTWAKGADSEEQFYVNLESSDTSDDFEATGEGSGTKLDGGDVGAANGQQMYIYRMYPEFSKISDPNIEANDGNINGSTEEAVLRFTITAIGEPGAPDLLFDDATAASLGTAGSGLIQFEVVASGGATDLPSYYLYDVTDTEVLKYATGNVNTTTGYFGKPSPHASLIIEFIDGSTNEELRIPIGETKTYEVRVDLSSFTDIVNTSTGVAADSFSINLQLDEAHVVQYVDRSKSDKLGTIDSIANLFKDKILGTVLYK